MHYELALTLAYVTKNNLTDLTKPNNCINKTTVVRICKNENVESDVATKLETMERGKFCDHKELSRRISQ
jgi:hypothetical protein